MDKFEDINNNNLFTYFLYLDPMVFLISDPFVLQIRHICSLCCLFGKLICIRQANVVDKPADLQSPCFSD